jgi:hypothetical protein
MKFLNQINLIIVIFFSPFAFSQNRTAVKNNDYWAVLADKAAENVQIDICYFFRGGEDYFLPDNLMMPKAVAKAFGTGVRAWEQNEGGKDTVFSLVAGYCASKLSDASTQSSYGLPWMLMLAIASESMQKKIIFSENATKTHGSERDTQSASVFDRQLLKMLKIWTTLAVEARVKQILFPSNVQDIINYFFPRDNLSRRQIHELRSATMTGTAKVASAALICVASTAVSILGIQNNGNKFNDTLFASLFQGFAIPFIFAIIPPSFVLLLNFYRNQAF